MENETGFDAVFGHIHIKDTGSLLIRLDYMLMLAFTVTMYQNLKHAHKYFLYFNVLPPFQILY